MFKKLIAEFFATLILVVVGCGVAIGVGCNTSAGVLATAAAFGLSIVILAYTVGQVSGGHANPAVSLAMALRGDITWKEFAYYCCAQVLGALVGSGILALLFFTVKSTGANSLDHIQAYMGASDYSFGVVAIGLVAEVVLSFLFILAVLGATSKKEYGHIGGILIGLALFGVHLLGIPLTGTSVNPARALSAIIFNMFDSGANLGHLGLTLIAVIIGPMIGAFLASCLWKTLSAKKEEK